MIDENDPAMIPYERQIAAMRGDGRFRSDDEMLACCALGLVEETAEVLCAIDGESGDAVLTELGDVVWYATTAAHRLDVTLWRVREAETATNLTTHPEREDHPLNMAKYAGIFAGLVKKKLFHEKPLNREWAIRYLAEVLDCVELIAQEHDHAFDDVLEANLAKLRKRFPSGGFTAAEANARADERANGGAT